MKRILTLCWACLTMVNLHAQTQAQIVWEYYQNLSEAAQAANSARCQTIRLDSLDTLFADPQELPAADSRWQILFEYHYEWEHVVGRRPEVKESRSHQAETKVPYQCDDLQTQIYTFQDLQDGLNLVPKSVRIAPEYSLPGMMARSHPYNTRWTARAVGDYLVLHYIHSYPHGNQTSFHREIKLYFKRIP